MKVLNLMGKIFFYLSELLVVYFLWPKMRKDFSTYFLHLFGPKLSIKSKNFWNCLWVCLGSETVCPEKDRQMAFYSPLSLYICRYIDISYTMFSWKGAHECVCGMGCGRRFPFQSRHECEAQVIGETKLQTCFFIICFGIISAIVQLVIGETELLVSLLFVMCNRS